MKKLITAILFFVIPLSLCSCGKINKNITFSGESSQTLKVEIYYSEKTYTDGNVKNLRDENTPLCVLNNLTEDGEKISELMNEISSLTFTQTVLYFPAAVDWVYLYEGYVVCVVYPNGYDIIAPKGQLYYSINSKGKERYKYGHANYSGETEWSVIIEQYITNH